MLDMGFKDELEKIFAAMGRERCLPLGGHILGGRLEKDVLVEEAKARSTRTAADGVARVEA